MAASPPQINSSHLQQMLQSAVKTFQWTYGIFWQFCQQQGVLIWAEGYYNGDIKTRKTMQPSVEESSASALQRSQQLRELYFSLLAGESNQQPPVRRFCASLSPEDLTELEWFYLLCISFSFPPGVGLPGKSYEKGHYIWLTAADEVDSRIFSRSILAKSAHIQTVVCIPSMDGVVELGYTEIVQEDPSFIQQVKNIFTDHHRQHHDHYHNHDHHNPPLGVVPPPKSTFEMRSSTSLSASTNELNFPLVPMYAIPNPPPLSLNKVAMEDEGVCDEFDANDSNLDLKSSQQLGLEGVGPTHVDQIDPGELLQLELLDDIERLSSPDYASDNLDSDFRTMGKSIDHSSQLSHHQVESFQDVDFVRKNSNGLQHHHQHEGLLVGKDWKCSGDASPLDSLTCQHQEDSHYTQILSTILQSQPSSTTSTATSPALSWHLSFSPNSVFSKWTAYEPTPCYRPVEGTSQSLLKYTLFTRPSLHSKHRPGPSKLYELSTSHVMAERRRREKLNERFIILRSLVPFVTKMDKASILGDTIEYLKHLRSKIQELEARERRRELERGEIWGRFEKRKVRVVDGRSEGGILKAVEAMEGDNKLEVSIIERDALVEMHCQHEEGLLLDVMLTLRDLRLEVTAVQSSLHDGYLAAELRAKVKETGNGRRASIMEVKRAVKQIMPDRDS